MASKKKLKTSETDVVDVNTIKEFPENPDNSKTSETLLCPLIVFLLRNMTIKVRVKISRVGFTSVLVAKFGLTNPAHPTLEISWIISSYGWIFISSLRS